MRRAYVSVLTPRASDSVGFQENRSKPRSNPLVLEAKKFAGGLIVSYPLFYIVSIRNMLSR